MFHQSCDPEIVGGNGGALFSELTIEPCVPGAGGFVHAEHADPVFVEKAVEDSFVFPGECSAEKSRT